MNTDTTGTIRNVFLNTLETQHYATSINVISHFKTFNSTLCDDINCPGDAVALLVGQRTCNSPVAVWVLAGHHCVVALSKLLTHVCLCHKAV